MPCPECYRLFEDSVKTNDQWSNLARDKTAMIREGNQDFARIEEAIQTARDAATQALAAYYSHHNSCPNR